MPYESHVIEASAIARPVLLVARKAEQGELGLESSHQEYDIEFVHENISFRDLHEYGITCDRLMKNIDFRAFCKKLLDSQDRTTDQEIIKLGRESQDIELYGEARRTSSAGCLSVKKSNLIFIQVNTQQYLDKKKQLSQSTYKYQTQVVDTLSKEIDQLFDKLQEINVFQVKQELINKQLTEIELFLKNHNLLQLTKDITLGRLLSILAALIMFTSSLSLGEKPVVDATKEVIKELKKSSD